MSSLQAEKLVQEVHDVLGRQRDGSTRLGDATDAAPLLGGLRIGKADPEGAPDGDGECSATLPCSDDVASVHVPKACCCRLLRHERLNPASCLQVSICTT